MKDVGDQALMRGLDSQLSVRGAVILMYAHANVP